MIFDQAPIQGINNTRTTVINPNSCLKSRERENKKFIEKVAPDRTIPKAYEIYMEPK